MMQSIIEHIIYDSSYFHLYLLVFAYFLFLYFVLSRLFLLACHFLEKKGLVNKIVKKDVDKKQIRKEIKHSLLSIFIFGFSGMPIIYLIRNGAINILEDNFLNVLIGVTLLSFWNEIHFFIVHRIMHLPFFMKKVHYIHHQSRIPTVYSVYSFHWLEAFLLSTVPLTIIPFIPVAPLVLVFYPLASILLNFAGHCNYRFGKSEGASWKLFATHHNEHHFKFSQNYGFASNLLDKLNVWFMINILNKK
ncbi:MAG: sterol desaturase family protein [Bacteroidota bacterium]|nr:sterol desaturase family protein [Bacteroidota bacterium]